MASSIRNLNRKAPSQRKNMNQVYSATRSRVVKVYKFTFGNAKFIAKMTFLRKKLDKAFVVSKVVTKPKPKPKPQASHRVVKAVVVANPVLTVEPIHIETPHPTRTPAIILTTPEGDVIPFDEMPPWERRCRTESSQQQRREWEESGLLYPTRPDYWTPTRHRSRSPKETDYSSVNKTNGCFMKFVSSIQKSDSSTKKNDSSSQKSARRKERIRRYNLMLHNHKTG